MLPVKDTPDALPLDEPQSRSQSRSPGNIHGPGFQPLRQILGHFPGPGLAAGAAIKQRRSRIPAQKQSRSLGAKKSLVPRHGNKIRSPAGQIHIQRARALGRVHNEWHPCLTAQPRHFFHRQNIAEHIGYMGKDRCVHPIFQFPPEIVQQFLPGKQPFPGNPNVRLPGI